MTDSFDIRIGRRNYFAEKSSDFTSDNSGANFIFQDKTNNDTNIDELYAEYEEAENAYNEAVQTQQSEEEKKEKEINTKQEQKENYQSDYEAQNSLIESLNSQIETIGTPKRPEKSDYAVTKIEGEGENQKEVTTYPGYDEALAEYNRKMEKLEQLEEQLQQAERAKNDLQTKISDIDNQVSQLNAQSDETSAKVQQAQTKMDSASAKLENAKAQQATEKVQGNEQENTDIEKELDDKSLLQLTEIAAKYTDKTELTEEEYQQIIAMEQLSQNFDKLYGQYKDELNTEGWIDNAYDGLKSIFGGITREMVQDEFDNYFKQMQALKNALNGNEEETQKAEYEELERKLNQDPANAQIYFTEYCGSDEKALEVINNWLAKNTDRINQEINYLSPMEYIAVMEDNEICIKEMKDGEEYFSLTLNEAADNFNCIFNPLEIIKDNDEVKELAPSDFNSAWKFYSGVEFDYNNIENAIKNGFEFTQINVGLSTAYQMEESLQNKTPEAAFELFKEQYDGNEDNAIYAFNNYYASLLAEEQINTEILNNKLTEIKAQKNDKGEIEFSMKFEPLNPDKKESLYNFFDYKGEDDNYEFIYNPQEYLNKMTENENEISFAYTNDLQVLNNLFGQINRDVAQKDILQNRYKDKFLKDNGYSVEEAMSNYLESEREAFGDNKIQDILNEYIGDMDSYAQKLSTIMTLGGIGLSFVCPAFGYVAMAGVFVDNTMDGINMATNQKQGENWQGLVKQTLKEASYMAIGMGINMTAQSAHSVLSRYLLAGGHSAKYAATAGTALEVGIDGALSIGFDVAATGDLNLSGNSIGLFMDIVSGIRGYKAICANRAAADSVSDSAGKNIDGSGYNQREIEWEARERTKQELQINEAKNAQDALIEVMQNPSGGKSALDSASVFDDVLGQQAANLKDFGFSPKNIESIIDSGRYNRVMEVLDKGIDISYAKDITLKLDDTQFAKCMSLIDEGFSPNTAKQLAILDERSIARAMELRAKGIPDMSLADSAVMTGEQAKRIDLLTDKHPNISKYYVSELASLSESQYKNAIRLIEQGQYTAPSAIEAVKADNFDLHASLAAKPEKMLKELTPEIEKELTRQAEILYKEYSSHIEEISYDTEILFGDLTGESGKLTAREKGIDSALKKLISKYEKGSLKIDLTLQNGNAITDICRKALADAYGTRIQLDSISPDITKLLLQDKGIDYDDFIKQVNNSVHSGNLKEIPLEYQDVLDELKVMQTQDIVDRITQEIIDGTFKITELRNYGDEISSYFTHEQLQTIAAAYKTKYGKELDIVTKINWQDGHGQSVVETDKGLISKDFQANYKDKGSVKDSGYASSQMGTEYILSDGTIGYGEYQVRGTELNQFADAEHIPYDIRQGKITAKDTQYSDVFSLIKNMSDDSFEAYNSYLTEIYQYLRLKELGIEISKPKISDNLSYSNGKSVPVSELEKLTYESLLKYNAH